MSSIQDRISLFINSIYESLGIPSFESFKVNTDKRLQKQQYRQQEAEAKKERYLNEAEKKAKQNMSKVLRQLPVMVAAQRTAKQGKANYLKQIKNSWRRTIPGV